MPTRTPATGTPGIDLQSAASGMAAVLCLVVTVIHLQDGNWLAFDKQPSYVGIGYVLLELTCVAVAAALLRRPGALVWLLALGCGVGPFAGYVLSRGPGLPGYTDDRGAWGEPLGVVSLVVEGLLVLVAVAGAVSARSTERSAGPAAAAATTVIVPRQRAAGVEELVAEGTALLDARRSEIR